MSSSKFDDIWKLMSEYSLEVELGCMDEDLICLICKKMMIDACQTACGCHFCTTCITNYVAEGDKYCPGGTEECNEEYLVVERDVMKNIRMNNRIYKTNVKCPNKSCGNKIELGRLKEHMRLCYSEAPPCPYKAIGCDKIVNHCQEDKHTELLMEWIYNLKNEVDFLKEGVGINKLEIEYHKEESRVKDSKIENIIEEMNKEKREMECVKEELINKENRIVILEEELREVRNELKSKLSVNTKESTENKRESERQIRMIEGFSSVTDLEKKMKNNIKMQLSDVKKELSGLRAEMENENYNTEIKTLFYIKWNQLCPNIDIDYVWKIQRISMRRKATYSEPFYSNKYKFCLSLYIAGDNLSLWCNIMKGEEDDNLIWPMRLAITIGILNQKTLRSFRSETFQYDSYNHYYKCSFDKPKTDQNEYSIGSSAFISYSLIQSIPFLVVDDSLMVSCVLTDI